MIVVFGSLFPVFAIIMLGFGLRKSSFIPSDNWKIIENLCFWILFPALLFKMVAEANFSTFDSGPFTFAILLFLGVVGLTTLALWPILKSLMNIKPPQYSTIYQTTTRWNGFVALVIAIKLFGDASLAYMAITLALMTIVIQVTNILMLSVFGTGARPTVLGVSKTIFRNPFIISIALGLVVNFAGITIWTPILDMLELLGRGALGLSLLSVGAGLSLAAALAPSRELLIGLIGKLVWSPLVMMASAWVFDVTGLALFILVLCASVPTAANGYIFAKLMGGDAELYAATSTLQTVASFFTIPLFLWLAQVWFGGI